MARFKNSDNSQGLFLTVNLSEQLFPGTFEWTLDYLINKMDLSLFEEKYNNDKKGADAYSPKTMLKIILYCYSRGILSSRKMEDACKRNIIVKSLSADSEPDHATIASFISSNNEAVKSLFVQILMQCQELELITGEMFAIDGCKLPSNASKEWSGKISKLKEKKNKLEKYVVKIMDRHRELDQDDEAKKKQKPFKETMGDDHERRARHIARIEKKLSRLETFLGHAEPKKGVSGLEVQTNITDPESAKIKGPHGYIQGYNGVTAADSKNQVIICAKAVGSGSESGSFPEMLDSLEENMKKLSGKEKPLERSICLGDTGFFSEDNLHEAAKREIDVIIPDPQFRQRDPDFEGQKEYKKTNTKKNFTIEDFQYNEKEDCYICPAGKILPYSCDVEFKERGTRGRQYRSTMSVCSVCPLKGDCISRKSGKGEFRALFIAYRKYEENLSEKMRDKIDDPAYREIYSRRQQIIEPVFSDITYCKGMDRFMLRTEKKVNAQWQLYCIVHNIGKCIRPAEEKYAKKNRKKGHVRTA